MGADDSGNTPLPLTASKEVPGTKLTGVSMSFKTGQDASAEWTQAQVRISPQQPGRPARILISAQTEEPNPLSKDVRSSYLRVQVEGQGKVVPVRQMKNSGGTEWSTSR